VRDLREHGIGQVLYHQGHAVGARPSETEQRAGQRLAGLESDTGPTEFASEPHATPVVCTFVEEDRLARADASDIDAVCFEIVRERLLNVERHPVEARVFNEQAIEISQT
jgi:hypothetical protein